MSILRIACRAVASGSILAALVAAASLRAESPAEQRVIEAIKSPDLSVVHLWAPWCSNCQAELKSGGWAKIVKDNPQVKFYFVSIWNDGGDGSGHSHIRLAKLDEAGQATKVSFVTSGTNDEIQPALSADSALHIAYYQISSDASGNGQLDVLVSNSNTGSNNGNANNGNGFTVQRVTSQSFPGVFNVPQFDPLVAAAYMGDYIANVSDGDHQYIAWGDNRDIVTNFLWPGGRHDPDVFFARQ